MVTKEISSGSHARIDLRSAARDKGTEWNNNINSKMSVSTSVKVRKEGNVLYNDTLNTFYLRLYGVRHMVKYHTDSERGNPLPPHGLLFPISSNGSFICAISQTG